MIIIRLSRVGVRRKPIYRLVVVDKKIKKGGKNLDIVGFWHPAKDLKKIDLTKVTYWRSKGARISEGVESLLKKK